MDRLFLDANILFSAAWSRDSRVKLLWRLDEVELVTSTYAVAEVIRHLQRREQIGRLRDLLTNIEPIATWEHIAIPEDIRLRQKDRPILQGAIAAQATHLITGDRQDFGRYFDQVVLGVEILLPATYLLRRE